MKSYLLIFSLVFTHLAAQACDDALKKFPRDCAIQDRFVALKNAYAAQGTNIDEIAEYRVIRFVDRYNWERAKNSEVKPRDIYKPAPDTWLVWDTGIREVMTTAGGKNGLLNNSYVLNAETISVINHNLLMNQGMNVKDGITDQTLKPGEYRKATSSGVGFQGGSKNYKSAIESSEASMDRFQQRWESQMGSTFSQLLKEEGIQSSDNASLRSGMSQRDGVGFVSYAPSTEVAKEIDWIKTFIKINLEQYRKGHPVLSPMELATVVQKWFVSVHPFSDGNGRTSRAIQDVILANFEMPVVPGGDLQEDATAVYEDYIEETYRKTEKLLATLELCQSRNASAFQCQTVAKIDEMSAARNQNFEQAKRKKD